MPQCPRHDIAVEPDIPVRTAHGHQLLSLTDVLHRAHEIHDLAVPIPPAASALLRILTAIAADLAGLNDPEMSLGEWTKRRRSLLANGTGFDPEKVVAYIESHTWDLFDPARPFLQDPSLAEQCKGSAGVNKFVFGRPAGNNLLWLTSATYSNTDPEPLPATEALWHLLLHHFYGPAGTCTPRTTAAGTSKQGAMGPLRSTISFHPLGRTLFETLLAGLTPFTGEEQLTPDTAPWEQPPHDPDAPLPPLTWPKRVLTGRSRAAVLLVPTPNGQAVTDAYLTWATQQPRLEATDPYLIYNTQPATGIAHRRQPRRAEADRAWWRDLDALLLAGDEKGRARRPQAFDTLNDLPSDLRADLRVRVHAFDQDRTVDRLWYSALTPPIFPWSQEHDPERADHIAACRTEAEALADLLTEVATDAFKAATNQKPPKRPRLCTWAARAREIYWREAETAFFTLLQGPTNARPRPVFAARAVTALRAVTAPTLARYRQAAPASARAVARLLADPDNARAPRDQSERTPR